MSTIRVERSHTMPVVAVRSKAEAIARRIEARHAVSWAWDGDHMNLVAPDGIASGTRGRVTIGAANVAVELHLPFALRPVRRMVEQQLEARLAALLS
jgi:hypothetical protein